MRVVGSKNRTDVERDPARALQRGRVLDAILSGAAPAHARGIFRGTQEYFDRLDDERQARAARILNAP
jgi:hypothetical protein